MYCFHTSPARREQYMIMGIILMTMLMVLYGRNSMAQTDWPKLITSAKGDTIKLYQPQSESFTGDLLKVRAAISVVPKGRPDPVFGCAWIDALIQTNRDTRIVTLRKVTVTNVRFAGQQDSTVISALKALLEKEISKWDITISLDQLLASLEDRNGNIAKDTLNTWPPRIIYRNTPSMLVLIDGEPKFEKNKELGVETVVNTAFIIVKEKKGKYYLFGGGQWFQSADITGTWAIATSLPKQIRSVDKKIKEKNKSEEIHSDSSGHVAPEIIISKEPAELIQTNGEPDMAVINGTDLLYVTNTNDDIFVYIDKQQYYVLLSGRWYRSSSLSGPWTYMPSDKLPVDFAKIPEGSVKDNVLVSVAGTEAAKDAILDAQVPQTAKVDRKKAATKVEYDGDPVFKQIEGTGMKYAVNTRSTVLQMNGVYYCVDNGVWFESAHAEGPWKVATSRPTEVEKIPPSSPVYNVKYVYIYESTPEYVYMGYTPGYTGAYVYGPTVVYGTGMYYNPWYGPYYYPRPATYGFSMHYNPWSGWSVGFHFSTGWFNMHIYGGGHPGYWGPPMYRPPYYRPPYYPPYYRAPVYPPAGYRPPPRYTAGAPSQLPAGVRQPINRPPSVQQPMAGSNRTNLYNNHKGVTTADRSRPMPATRDNAITTDRQGNVYKKNGNGWQQRQKESWQNVNNNGNTDLNQLDKQQQMRDRGDAKAREFNQYNRSNVNRPATTHQRPAPVRRR